MDEIKKGIEPRTCIGSLFTDEWMLYIFGTKQEQKRRKKRDSNRKATKKPNSSAAKKGRINAEPGGGCESGVRKEAQKKINKQHFIIWNSLTNESQMLIFFWKNR